MAMPSELSLSMPSNATSGANVDLNNPFKGGNVNMSNNTGLYVLAGAAVLAVLLWKKL